MRVFISYSRCSKDQAIAGLVSQALRDRGFETLFDEGQIHGTRIIEEVCDDIRECDIVLVLITKNSLRSAWVNQEIGFAEALYKPILPMQIAPKRTASALLSGINPITVGNWFDGKEMDNLARHISTLLGEREPQPVLIEDERERTRMMIQRLEDVYLNLLKNPDLELQIYEQCALSIFSVGGDPPSSYSHDYWTELLNQRECMEKLVKHERVTFWLHMWPETRNYEPEARKQRMQCILEWLEESSETEKTYVWISDHLGPNILAIEDEIAYEGLRAGRGDEYKYTLLWRHPSRKVAGCFSALKSGDWKNHWQHRREAAKTLREVESKHQDQ